MEEDGKGVISFLTWRLTFSGSLSALSLCNPRRLTLQEAIQWFFPMNTASLPSQERREASEHCRDHTGTGWGTHARGPVTQASRLKSHVPGGCLNYRKNSWDYMYMWPEAQSIGFTAPDCWLCEPQSPSAKPTPPHRASPALDEMMCVQFQAAWPHGASEHSQMVWQHYLH